MAEAEGGMAANGEYVVQDIDADRQVFSIWFDPVVLEKDRIAIGNAAFDKLAEMYPEEEAP